MSAATPIVSVLITAYRREKLVAQAIESVLASSFTNFELIVVDDCSDDNTALVAKQYAHFDKRVKVYVNDENLGDYPNRNKAASLASGKFIKYLDSDDIMYRHCLDVMVHAMELFPDAGFGLSCVGDAKQPYPQQLLPREAYLEHFGGKGHFDRAPGSSIITKKAFTIVGGFSGQRMIGDYEMWLKLGRYFPLVKLPVDLYWSRMHEDQESRSDYAKQYESLRKKVVDKAFSHPDCPLSRNEILLIKGSLKKHQLKKSIMNFIN